MSHVDPLQKLFERLNLLVRDQSSLIFALQAPAVVIYGAGYMGRKVYQVLAEAGVPIRGFLDRAAQPDAFLRGLPILDPDDASLTTADRQAMHVVISNFTPGVEVPPIVTRLKELGYVKLTTFVELHACFAREFGDHYWLTDRAYYLPFQASLQAASALWSDAASRDLYQALLNLRFTHDYTALPVPDPDSQYFPSDLPPWPQPLRFVDCGSFVGDTLQGIVARRLPLEAVAAFEPEPASFAKLSRFVCSPDMASVDTICAFPCGVDAAAGQIRFASGESMSSHASSGGDMVVQVVTLDEALPRFRPNLIKMDIEGAEYNALVGARRIIGECRPGLAVCVYHRPGHLWQIPLLVQQLTGGGGRYFLRSHGHNGFELVLYWLPD